MKYLFIFFAFIASYNLTYAQELRTEVTINTPKLQTADPKLFENLKAAIEEFMNSQKWTDDIFEPKERINVQLTLSIQKELSATSFKADLGIKSSRPVYNSNFETILLTHIDKEVTFSYQPFQPFEYSKNTFNNNLTSILSFYAYIILGLDYDSFSPFGGEKYYSTAQEILNTVPQSVAGQTKGWRSIDGNRNRYWIIENFLNPRIRPYRQAIYDYHRKAMDVFHKDHEEARDNLLKSLELLEVVNRDYPNAMALHMFANAKSDEIVEIFKEGTPSDKTKVKLIMSKVDASNASKYRKMGR